MPIVTTTGQQGDCYDPLTWHITYLQQSFIHSGQAIQKFSTLNANASWCSLYIYIVYSCTISVNVEMQSSSHSDCKCQQETTPLNECRMPSLLQALVAFEALKHLYLQCNWWTNHCSRFARDECRLPGRATKQTPWDLLAKKNWNQQKGGIIIFCCASLLALKGSLSFEFPEL